MADGPGTHPGLLIARDTLVALHVLAVLVLALPETGGLLNEKAWQDPSAQSEFSSWAGRLSAIGPDWTKDELQDTLWTIATAWDRGMDVVKVPFAPYRDHLGVRQSWMMFAAPQQHPALLHLMVHDSTGWHTIYVTRSDEFTWKREFFDHDRIRSYAFLYGFPHIQKSSLTRDLVRYLAPDAAREFPEADRFRVRFERTHTPSPAQARQGIVPPSRWEARYTVELDKYR